MNFLRYGPEWHAFVPVISITRNTKLSRDARFLWIALQSHCSPDSPKPFPSIATMRKMLGHYSERKTEFKSCGSGSIKKYMRELKEWGALSVEQVHRDGRFRHNVYTLSLPLAEKVAVKKQWVKKQTSVKQPTKKQTTVLQTSKIRPLSNSNGRRISTGKNGKPKTTTTSVAPSALASGAGAAFGDGKVPAEANLLDVWKNRYIEWFGIKYRFSQSDKIEVEKYLASEPSEHDQTELMVKAMAAWIDREQGVDRHKNGFDPFFYRLRCNRLSFVLKYPDELAQEMESQNSESANWGWESVFGIIKDGREAFVAGS